jgi:hypothetical protein
MLMVNEYLLYTVLKKLSPLGSNHIKSQMRAPAMMILYMDTLRKEHHEIPSLFHSVLEKQEDASNLLIQR